MRSSLSYGRRRSQSTKVLVLAMIAAITATAFIVFGGPDGDPVRPPLGRTEADTTNIGSGTPEQVSEPVKEPSSRTESVPAPAPEPEDDPDELARMQAALARVEASGDLQKLRKMLGPLTLDTRFPRTARKAWLTKLDDLNVKLVFSPQKCAGFQKVKLQRGDTYTHVSRRLKKQSGNTVATGMLQKINRRPAKRLRAGQYIKVPEEAVSVVVLKRDYTLYVLLGSVPVAHYPVGLGRDGLTPEGQFYVGGKARNPVWTDPNTGKVLRYGEPGHLVGSRWLGFYEDGQRTGFGIHGTADPESVGRSQSDGCIRLLNRHVEELFELVQEGARVDVRS